jgi:hypothetical protein
MEKSRSCRVFRKKRVLVIKPEPKKCLQIVNSDDNRTWSRFRGTESRILQEKPYCHFGSGKRQNLVPGNQDGFRNLKRFCLNQTSETQISGVKRLAGFRERYNHEIMRKIKDSFKFRVLGC